MRIVFAGTPEFAASALASILDAGIEVALVLTQPDRPAGRGQKLVPSAVKQLALARRVAVDTPVTLSLKKGGAAAAAAHDRLRATGGDALVVAAYGLLLPQAVLDIPRGLPDAGCGRITALNIHGSLLPRWRGAAPVARAIESGDGTTGITIMQMDAGLDTGPMLLAEATPIGPGDTTATLTERLAGIGARLIVAALQEAAAGRLRAVPQPAEGATYAEKLGKDEGWLDLTQDAALLARRVRAFDPFPVACLRRDELTLRIWRAHVQPAPVTAPPGTVVAVRADGLFVACGTGILVITEMQRPGSRRLRVAEFIAGAPIRVGDRLVGAPPPAA